MAMGKIVQDSALLLVVGQAYQRASVWCQDQRHGCAELAHRCLPHLSVEALEESIKYSLLDARQAVDVQQQLEAFYELLFVQTPELIGGRVPDAGLYAR